MSSENKLQFSARVLPILGLAPVLLVAVFVALTPDFQTNSTIHWLGKFLFGIFGIFCAILILRAKTNIAGNARKILAIGFVGAGALDISHGIATIPTTSADTLAVLVPWGWLPSSVLLPVLVCFSIWIGQRESRSGPTNRKLLVGTALMVALFVLASIVFLSSYSELLPSAYYPLRNVSRPMELAPALLFTLALIGQFYWGSWRSDVFNYCLLLSLVVSVIVHTLFMPFATNNFDNFFAAAMIGKIVSYIFVLSGLILQMRESLRQETMAERVRQRAIVETASDGIITFDATGKIDTFNAAAEMLFGYSAEEALGKNIAMLTTETLAIEHDQYLQRVRDKEEIPGSAYAYEAVGRRKDGSTFPVESAINEVQLGETQLFTAIVRDITERKEKQQKLEEVSERLTLALESAGLGSWEQDLDSGALFWDKKMFELYRMDPAIGTPSLQDWVNMTLPEDRDTCNLAHTNAIENGTPIDIAFRIQLSDGTIRWIKVDSKVSLKEGDKPLRLVGVNRDITESVQHLEELETARNEADEANRAKSAFLATMSHEIRTPLNGVVGLTEVLQKTRLDSHQEDIAGLIAQSAHSLMDIIDDVLDFSKIEAGKMEIDPTDISIANLAADVCAVMTNLAEQSDVDLTLFTDPAIPNLVVGDGLRLRQILTNLINNAIKFSSQEHDRGKVALRVELQATDGNQVVINFNVTDNGVGMDSATQNRLFNPFTQADASTSRRFGGTGLGLTISQRLAQLMAGEISVQSELGAGSTFTLQLPVTAIENPAGVTGSAAKLTGTPDKYLPPLAVPSREEAIASKQLILIAEDNDTNRKVIRHQLTVLGYQADVAANGVEALERWRTGDYALLLTDLQMPVMDGYELAKNIRAAEHSTKHMPIIALTANTLMQESERCRAVGMNGFLTKPASLEDLRSTLDDYIKKMAS